MHSIRAQLILLFIFVTTTTLGGFSIYEQALLRRQLNERFHEQQQEVVARLRRDLTNPIWAIDEGLIKAKLESTMILPDVHAIYLLEQGGGAVRAGFTRDMDGVPRLSLSQNNEKGESVTKDIYPPSDVDAQRRNISTGRVVIFFSRDHIKLTLHDALLRRIFEVLVMDLLLLAMLIFSLRIVFVPLRSLRDALFNLASNEGEELGELPKINRIEFDEVIEGFNLTLNKLKKIISRRGQAEAAAREATHVANGALEQARASQDKLIESNKQLEYLSNTDQLTRLFNRLKLDQVLEDEFNRSNRYSTSFALVLLDIDHFKHINDTFGHQVGDRVLVGIAELLQSKMRNVDVIGRWGGEEFLIICPDTNMDGAMGIADKLRQAISEHTFQRAGNQTASFGVTCFRAGDSIDRMIARADAALYRCKSGGRNCVESEA